MLQLRLNMTIFTVEWGFWPHCNNDGRCFFVTKRNKHLLKIENVIFICNDIASTSLTSNNGSTCKDIKKWGYIMLYYLHMNGRKEIRTYSLVDAKRQEQHCQILCKPQSKSTIERVFLIGTSSWLTLVENYAQKNLSQNQLRFFWPTWFAVVKQLIFFSWVVFLEYWSWKQYHDRWHSNCLRYWMQSQLHCHEQNGGVNI